MIRAIIEMIENSPKNRIKRLARKLRFFMEGQKMKRKWERELDKLERPKYKTPTL